MIAHLTVVPDVHTRLKNILIANARDTAALLCAPVQRRVTANLVAVADVEARRFAVVFQILADFADGRSHPDSVLTTDRRIAVNDDM